MPASPVRTVSPSNWQPNGAFPVPDNLVPVQIVGQRPGRKDVVVVNTGANDCLLNNSASPSGIGITLAAGGAWTLETEGEVYAFSILGTSLDIVETWWPTSYAQAGSIPDLTPAIKN